MRIQVAELLIDIEAELRQLGLWERQAPPAEALASEQPFCIDTLTLPQWLQFIFLPRLYRLLEQDAALPDRCGIAPLAEEYFRGTGLPSAGLEQILLRMDEVLSEGTGGGQ
ncbi:MAG: YqcC family protein [Halieaceae bacterium]|nr:YqcC family protein [Halieaceae bacterium]